MVGWKERQGVGICPMVTAGPGELGAGTVALSGSPLSLLRVAAGCGELGQTHWAEVLGQKDKWPEFAMYGKCGVPWRGFATFKYFCLVFRPTGKDLLFFFLLFSLFISKLPSTKYSNSVLYVAAKSWQQPNRGVFKQGLYMPVMAPTAYKAVQ